jgi:hypothetical protein
VTSYSTGELRSITGAVLGMDSTILAGRNIARFGRIFSYLVFGLVVMVLTTLFQPITGVSTLAQPQPKSQEG